MTTFPTPDKDQIALLPPFDQLGLEHISLVASAPQAAAAYEQLKGASALGFDTESKPTFVKNEASSGPHIVQLSSLNKAWVFQLTDPECVRVVGLLLASNTIIKAGFGLRDDKRRIIHKLGAELANIVDLNHVFHAKGYRKDMGVRGAVALLFERRFLKSKKASTSNWANPELSPAQIIYAANDAYGAMRVFEALELTAADLAVKSAPKSESKVPPAQ